MGDFESKNVHKIGSEIKQYVKVEIYVCKFFKRSTKYYLLLYTKETKYPAKVNY